MSADFEIERHCSCEKKPGIIQLSSTTLVWTPDSAAHGSEIRIPFTCINNFQVSKEGSAKKAMIRILYTTDIHHTETAPRRVTFDFSTRFSDRDAVRDVLNTLQRRATNGVSNNDNTNNNINNNNNNNNDNNNDKTNSNATSNTSNKNLHSTKSKPPVVKPVSREEGIRRARIMAHKEVQKLHKQLVGGSVVSDDDFWDAMKWRYKDTGEPRGRGGLEEDDDDDDDNNNTNDISVPSNGIKKLKMTGNQGVPSEAFDPSDETGIDNSDKRPSSSSGNSYSDNRKLTSKWAGNIPSAAERHLVFMEKPAVRRAYNAKVKNSNEMNEKQFWTLFISSSLAGRRVGRMTKSDTTRTAEADAMFAPFEAEEKRNAFEERSERARQLARDIDLDRADDHRGLHLRDAERRKVSIGGTIGSKADESAGLRLMRLVNRHGDLVLNEGGVGAWSTDGVDIVRPLEDLQVETNEQFARIGMRNKRLAQLQQSFARSVGNGHNGNGNGNVTVGDSDGDVHVVAPHICNEVAECLRRWEPDVKRFRHAVTGSERRLDDLLKRMRP